MNLPSLQPDKANHFAYGAVIGALAASAAILLDCAAFAATASTAASALFGAAKELADGIGNYRATGHWHTGSHGLEFKDFLATAAGGWVVAWPLFATSLGAP
jgi:hypothetical protein